MIAKITYRLKHKEVAVDAEAPCSSLKPIASELSGLPVEHLKLLYRGKPLPDDETMKAIGFKNGGKIFVFEADGYSRKQPLHEEESNKAEDQLSSSEDPSMQKMLCIDAEIRAYEQQVEIGLEKGFGNVNPAGIVLVLTQKLEELDALSVSGETRDKRRTMIKSINVLCDKIESRGEKKG